MDRNIEQALANVDVTYDYLVNIADEITTPLFNSVNNIISTITSNINSMTPDMISKYMIDLSTTTYRLAEIKDKALLKQSCSETLKEEKYARQFNTTEGSVAVRQNQATLDCSEETLVELLYTMTASALKTKLDECHRVVDTLKSVLMYKMAEMKQVQTMSFGEPGESTYIME